MPSPMTTNLPDRVRLIAEDQSRRDYCETLDEAAEQIDTMRKGLERALVYLEHPDVKAIGFASPSIVLANQIREHLTLPLSERASEVGQ